MNIDRIMTKWVVLKTIYIQTWINFYDPVSIVYGGIIMSQIDLFEDIAQGVGIGISEDEFKEKIHLIKKRYPSLSYERIYRIIDQTIAAKCWSYDYWSERDGRYVLPFEVMIGRKYWELATFITCVDARSREDQVFLIKLLAES